MTSFSIDEHSSMNTTIPNLNSSDTTPTNVDFNVVSNTNAPPPLAQCNTKIIADNASSSIIAAAASTITTTTINTTTPIATNNDENETEISDTHSSSSPLKDKDGKECKERDDLKEKLKAEKKAAKKLLKEMAICKIILEEMEVSDSMSLLTFKL